MICLTRSLGAWRTPDFESVLIGELATLDASHFPLQAGLKRSSYALSTDVKLMFIVAVDSPDAVKARIGIHYQGMIAGCNCADDPSPVDSVNEYCEVELCIDKRTAEASFTLMES